jgi:tetratricopeptide (TPR) repeat protein
MTKTFTYYFWIAFAIVLQASCKSEAPTEVKKEGDPIIDEITSLITKDPSKASLYYQRAQAYIGLSKFPNAIIDLQRAIAIDSLNPDYFHLLSDAFMDSGDLDNAYWTMLRVMKKYPERIPTLLKVSETKYIMEDYDGSIMTLNQITRLDPQNAEAYYMLGVNFLKLNDTERAINGFTTATEMDSKLTDAWIALGEIYEKKKDAKALKYYESAVLSDPNSMPALHAKAFYLQNNKNVPEAKAIYRSIIKTNQNYADAYLNLGLIYIDQDSLNKAYEQFNTLVGVAPTYHLGFYYRGIVQEKQGKKTEAKKDYQSATNLEPNDKRAADALSKMSIVK